MALKKCEECGKEVSTKAKSCPHCGAKQKREGIGCGGVLLILIAIFVLFVLINSLWEYNVRQGRRLLEKTDEIKRAAIQEEFERQVNENEIKAFEDNIERHYAELVKLAEQKRFDSALDKVKLFKQFGKTDYKDINKYYKTLSTQSLSKKVKNLPASDIEGNLKIYNELLKLNPNNQTYKDKINHYQRKRDQYNQIPLLPFKVVWKEGRILGLLVPSNTTKEQLKALVYKFRQAKRENTLSSLIPPINLGLNDKYTTFVIFIFSDPKWATLEEYEKYVRASLMTAEGNAIAKAYINHIMAYYEYEIIDEKEYGSLGYDGRYNSVHYKKLF